MGLSTTASHVIWFIAITAAGAMSVETYFEVSEALEEGREARDEIVQARTETALENARFCWDGTKLRVMATNAGDRVIDALNVSVVVDGVAWTGFVANVETSTNTGFWQPGYNATFNKTGVASDPSRVVFFTPDGAAMYAEHTTCPVLNTVVVTPSPTSMDIGETATFQATGYDQFGALYTAQPYTWSSSCGSITVLDSTRASFTAGTVSGACTLTATSESVSGNAAITIDPDPPASMVVAPDPRGVPAGGSAAFTTTVYDQYGNVNTTSPITWSTNAGSISAGGVLTAQTTAQLGRSVTATTTGAVSDSATVDVYADAPQSALVTPDGAGVTVGTTRQYTVVLTDQYGNANSTAPVTWSTNGGSISAGGLLTAQTTAANGKTVTATSGAASDSATVDIWPAAPASAIVSPDPRGVPAGGSATFSAALYDSYGNVNSTATVTWSTNAGTISVTGELTAQTTAALGKSVTATSGAASDSATVDVYPAAPASALVTPDGAGVTAGTTQQYTAVFYDAYGNVNATAPATWSTNAGSISAGGLLTAQTTAANGKSVTATSGAASDSATVDIWPAAPATALVTPDGAGVTAGTTRQYTAVFYDGYGNVNTTATATWSTNGGSISAGGLLTAQTTAANGKSVTATSGAASDSATVDIWPAAPSTIVVAPDPRGVPAGASAAFTSTIYDTYGNLNTTASVTWTTNAGTITAGGVLTAQTTAQLGRSVTATTTGSVADSATVDVYAAAPDHITVSPSSATVYFNNTRQFSATVYDVYNNVNSTATVSWSATSGSITSGGLYTAPATGGSVTVTASASPASGTASVTVAREVHVDAMATYKNGSPATSFRKGTDTVEVRTTVRDHESALVQGGASVTVEFEDSDGVIRATVSGTTDSGGIASTSYAIPSGAKKGTWIARVTTIGGTNLVYNSALNVVTTVNFTVT